MVNLETDSSFNYLNSWCCNKQIWIFLLWMYILFFDKMLYRLVWKTISKFWIEESNLIDFSLEILVRCNVILTRTKIRVCDSPMRYFPSETWMMGNCVGHWHSATNSLTCKSRKMENQFMSWNSNLFWINFSNSTTIIICIFSLKGIFNDAFKAPDERNPEVEFLRPS